MRASQTDEPVHDLLSALIAIVTAWSSVTTQGRIAQEVGVTIPESDVRGLYTLGLIGSPVRPARLADDLQLTRPTTSKMIARLVEAGLVERTTLTQDGRGAEIALTASGQEAHGRLVDAGLGIIHAALDGVPADQAAIVAGVMHRIVDALPGK